MWKMKWWGYPIFFICFIAQALWGLVMFIPHQIAKLLEGKEGG